MGHHYQLKHFSEKEEQNETLTCSDLRGRGFNMQVYNCEFFSLDSTSLNHAMYSWTYALYNASTRSCKD